MSSTPAECTILSLWYHRHGDFFYNVWVCVPTTQVCGSPRVYVPDGTDARDDGKRGKCAKAVLAAVAAPRATRVKYRTGKWRCVTDEKLLSIYTITAREAHLCGERGSPAAGKGIVCLWLKFMDRWPRHGQCAYMCLTARTLTMTDKETAKAKVF